MKTRSHRKAFSLVEMLISVSIIAMLAALLAPAVSGMMNKGKDTRCIGNLRQWGIAFSCYLADNAGQLPDDGNEDSPTWANVANTNNVRAWYNVLPPYMGLSALKDFTATERTQLYGGQKASIFQCPRATWLGTEKTASGPIFSYAFNSKIFTSDAPAVVTVAQLGDHGMVNANNRIISAADIPMLVDTRASTKEPKAVAGMNNDFGTARSYTRRLSNRHGKGTGTNGMANIVFFDGSVRSYAMGPIMDSNGKNITTSPIIWEPWAPDNP